MKNLIFTLTLFLVIMTPWAVRHAQGQALLDSLISPNEESYGRFGWSVAGIGGDVNADGIPDVIVGALFEDPGSTLAAAGRAYILSGATGTVLDTLQSPDETNGGSFGWSVAGVGGDVNADGIPDVIVGATGEGSRNAGRAYIISGATGTVLDTLQPPDGESGGSFGCSVAGAGGDVNSDGIPDVIVGAFEKGSGSTPSYAGRAYIISGATGTVLRTLQSPHEEIGGWFGCSVAGVGGDVSGDGIPDVIVGAYKEDPGSSPTNAGRAYIFSGASGTLVHTLQSPAELISGHFGRSVAGIGGDLDADGTPDVIVGANQEGPGNSPPEAGRAYIISGATGTVLDTLQSPNEESNGHFGRSVAGIGGDVNADGTPDVIVGANQEGPGSSPLGAGRAYIISGGTSNVLQTLHSPHQQNRGVFGHSVAGTGGDVNGDGTPDVIVGANQEGPGSSPFAAGRVYIFSGATAPVSVAPVGRPSDISASPNPFKHHVVITLTNPDWHAARYQILTRAGKLVEAGNVSNQQLSVGEELLPGHYFAILRTEDGRSQTVKLVKKAY